ncbi:hypothetical protein [Meiothermus sp. Pnk-1]|uniref:hypothetical protein n=1 Tax=Meiothermus sp. Pnk-1 TaxID=873128 RepID=UPI000D7CAE06|nr:hypothetical protein [Meiothermus sp. Pnk-1]PZA07417.1 hypothetical protein DNA98_07245 [Meiothermus sp. Pnk-1]
MRVEVFPGVLNSDQIEGWLARGLAAELDRATVSDLTPRPVRLPIYEGGTARGFLEGRLVGREEGALVIEGTFEDTPVRVAAGWNEVARAFDLEDTPLYLWRSRQLPEEGWQAWRADLERLGLEEKAGLLKDGPLCRAEPTPQNAWAFWLAAWRFGGRVALDLGMRRRGLERAFAALKERLPELPENLLERSREAEGWGKAEVRRVFRA